MALKLPFLFITTLLLTEAIPMSVNRNNYNVVHRYSTTYENDWRPLLNQETIKFKPTLSTNVWSFNALVQPGINNLQEYFTETKIQKAQTQYKAKEITPSSMLGSFNLFTQKHTRLLPSETRKHSFLLPTNRDPFIFHNNALPTRTATPFYYNVPQSFSMSKVTPSNGHHMFTANFNPFSTTDRSIPTYMHQNSNKKLTSFPGAVDEFQNNKSVEQNKNPQHENFQAWNSKNNVNSINIVKSQKIEEQRPINLHDPYPENRYVTSMLGIKLKPAYQNYVLPSKIDNSNLPITQTNFLSHYSNNVKKNNSDSYSQNIKSDNDIENIYKMFHEIRFKNKKDVVMNVNLTQTANTYNTTPNAQQYLNQKPSIEYHVIPKIYGEQSNIDLNQYNNNPNGLFTSNNKSPDQEFLKQNEFLSKQLKQEKLKLFEKQQKDQEETFKHSGILRQLSQEQYKLDKDVESKKIPSTHRIPLSKGKNFKSYERIVSRPPTTLSYIITTELPLYEPDQSSWNDNYDILNTNLWQNNTYLQKSQISKTPVNRGVKEFTPTSLSIDTEILKQQDIKSEEMITESTIYTPTVQQMTTQRMGNEKEKEKSIWFVEKPRRRPVLGHKPHSTMSKVKPVNQESTVKFEESNPESHEIDIELENEFKNGNVSKIGSTNNAYAVENPTINPGVEINFAETDLSTSCQNLCSSNANNYEYVIESTKPSFVNNDYVSEPSKLSTSYNYEKLQTDDTLTTSVSVIDTINMKNESKILTTPPFFVKTTPKIRLSRPANTLRPRFSIKDYQSKIDYKNRLFNPSNVSAENSQKKSAIDFINKKQLETSKVMPGRYKYMSRISYRTSSTTPSSESLNYTSVIHNRNKFNKYSTKERLKNNFLNMSRINPVSMTNLNENNLTFPSEIHPTGYQPEHRSKLRTNIKDEVEVVPNFDLKTPKIQNKTIKQNLNLYRQNMKFDHKRKEALKAVNNSLTNKQLDEEILEKASQSVADLTSSASALHNKASLTKTVLQSPDTKEFLSHLKTTYGAPTLPIQAFFPDLSVVAD